MVFIIIITSRYSTEPEVIAIDIIRAVTTHLNPSLRTEAYCQLIKQLRNNPSPQSSNLVSTHKTSFLTNYSPYYCVVVLFKGSFTIHHSPFTIHSHLGMEIDGNLLELVLTRGEFCRISRCIFMGKCT